MTAATFETGLVNALQPVRFHALAIALYQFFETGLFTYLKEKPCTSLATVSADLEMDSWRLEAFVLYLRNEGYVELDENSRVSLSQTAIDLEPFRPWYTMMIGGYTPTWMGMGKALMAKSGPAPRDLRQVGVGSCGISNYDAIPLTRRLMALSPTACTRLLDLGCGNGMYLVYFCLALEGLEHAWGIEPSAESCEDARKLVTQHGLDDRVSIIHGTAASALKVDNELSPNFAVIGFVLHEILGQAGRQGVVDFLKGLVGRFPSTSMTTKDNSGKLADIKHMGDGLGLAYYNPYSTLHPFTLQKLESPSFWEAVFHDAGLKILACLTTDTNVDSTGLEIGYLLRCAD